MRAVSNSDYRLVTRALSGDRRAGEALVTRHHGDLFNLFMWLTRDPELAENLTQETFVRVWERLSQFRGESSFRTWSHSIAYSILSSHHREEARESHALREYALRANAHPDARRRAETRAALAEALAQLSKQEQQVVVLCKLQGFTLAEAAEMVSRPVGTLAWQMAQALRKLRGLLAEDISAGDVQPAENR